MAGDPRSTEVFADHAFAGGYDLNSVYGKKKPSNTSTGGGSTTSHASAGASEDGPYGGSHSSSPYTKPATSQESYSEAAAAHGSAAGYGPGSGHAGGRFDVSEQDGFNQPGYGRKPTYGEGAYDNESESGWRPSGRRPGFEQDYESESQWRPEHGRKPAGYGEDVSEEGYASRPGYGRPPGHGEKHETEGYGRKPAIDGEGEEWPLRPSRLGHSKYGDPEEDTYVKPPRQSQFGGFGENEGFGGGGSPGHGPESEYGRPRPGPKMHDSSEETGFGGRKPAWQEESGGYGRHEGPLEYGGGRKPEAHEYGVGRHPGHVPESEYGRPRPPHEDFEETGYGGHKSPWQEDTGYNGYGRHEKPVEYESGHRKHSPSHESEFPRPPSYGRPGYGRRDEDDVLASETGGLSLGTYSYEEDSHKHGHHNRKHDDSSEDEDNQKKHGHHHRKHDDDY